MSGRIIIHIQGVNKKTDYIKAGARMHGFRVWLRAISSMCSSRLYTIGILLCCCLVNGEQQNGKNKFDRFVLAFYKRTRELLSYKRGVSRLKYCKWLVVTSFPFPNLLIVQYFILQFKCYIFDNFYMRTIFKGVVLGGGVPRPIFVKFIMWIYSIWIFKEENHLSWPPLDPLC